MDTGSSVTAEPMNAKLDPDDGMNDYESRFITDWNFDWCKYSEIKSEDKTLDAELDCRPKDFTSDDAVEQCD